LTAAPVLLDFEARSRADLKACGGRTYWAHASTEALCCAWYDTADGAVGVWFPGEQWPHPRRTLAAHNAAGFDRFGAARYGFDASAWIDTSELTRRAGLPGALDELGVRWTDTPKDRVGSALTRSLSSVRRPPHITAPDWRELSPLVKRERGALPDVTPEKLERVIGYCLSDVALLAAAWPRLSAWDSAALVGVAEHAVHDADWTVNDRGIAFDAELAHALLRADAQNAEHAVRAAACALGWTAQRVREVAGSPQQCAAELGTIDARKSTLQYINHPIAEARRALASIARGKLRAGLTRVSPDGRLRDMLRYYGAHTGRWSSSGMQLHNLPRPADEYEHWDDAQLCAAADAVLAGGAASGELVDLLLRATLTAAPGKRLAVADFSGVEARALAFCADDRPALEVFASGRNPYFVAASAIYGVPYESVSKGTEQYAVGKIAELALGYQGAHGAFTSLAATQGVSVDGLDIGAIVKAWRRQHGATVRFWHAVQDAWQAAAEGHHAWTGPFEFCPGTEDELAVFLPSGRAVVYPEPRVQTPHYSRHAELSYRGTRGREHVYGGKLAENLIQAYCRDLLAAAFVHAEAAGLRPVLTVHDEIVCEVAAGAEAEAYALLCALMIDVPSWAAGFPAGVAGFTGRRYRK